MNQGVHSMHNKAHHPSILNRYMYFQEKEMPNRIFKAKTKDKQGRLTGCWIRRPEKTITLCSLESRSMYRLANFIERKDEKTTKVHG